MRFFPIKTLHRARSCSLCTIHLYIIFYIVYNVDPFFYRSHNIHVKSNDPTIIMGWLCRPIRNSAEPLVQGLNHIGFCERTIILCHKYTMSKGCVLDFISNEWMLDPRYWSKRPFYRIAIYVLKIYHYLLAVKTSRYFFVKR